MDGFRKFTSIAVGKDLGSSGLLKWAAALFHLPTAACMTFTVSCDKRILHKQSNEVSVGTARWESSDYIPYIIQYDFSLLSWLSSSLPISIMQRPRMVASR